MRETLVKSLAKAALEARENSYSPYSGFMVGAALADSEGMIYKGCNIENAAYTPSNCAERTAFFNAVSQNIRSFQGIAIAGGKKDETLDYCAPCGVCRQVMAEFCDPETFQIILVKSDTEYRMITLKDLFPESFGPGNLA